MIMRRGRLRCDEITKTCIISAYRQLRIKLSNEHFLSTFRFLLIMVELDELY